MNRIYICPLLLLCTFLCVACSKLEEEEKNNKDPLFCSYCMSENDIKTYGEDVCVITGWGFSRIRFRAGKDQSYELLGKHLKDPYVQTVAGQDWLLTPTKYKNWNCTEFGNTSGIKTRHKFNGPSGGLPAGVIQELLDVEDLSNYNREDIVIIIGLGKYKHLGISEEAKDRLRELKNNKEIGSYHILDTKAAVKKHNACIKKGKKVFALLHTTC